MQRFTFQLEDLEGFLALGEESDRWEKSESAENEVCIECSNVSYKYEEDNRMVLKHLNFQISLQIKSQG